MRTLAGALALAGLLALTGCVGGDPIPTLPPTPSATPIFASEEDALAAAEEAYAEYNEVSNLIAQEGGAQSERIAPFVTEDQLENEIEGLAYLSENGLHTSGEIDVKRVVLQQYSEADEVAEVIVYACLDVSSARLFDSTGADRTPAERPALVALEVAFVGESADSLLLSRSEQWSDLSFCS